MPYLEGSKPCCHGCGKRYIPARLGGTKESRVGWYVQANGKVWCPDHIPSEEIRKKRGGKIQ